MKQALYALSILGLSTLLLAACSPKNISPANELEPLSSIPSFFEPGDPDCQSLGLFEGFKPQTTSGNATTNGSYTNSEGITVELTDINTEATPPFSWRASLNDEPFGIDAVIVKGTQDGANIYYYDTEQSSDTNLSTPTNSS